MENKKTEAIICFLQAALWFRDRVWTDSQQQQGLDCKILQKIQEIGALIKEKDMTTQGSNCFIGGHLDWGCPSQHNSVHRACNSEGEKGSWERRSFYVQVRSRLSRMPGHPWVRKLQRAPEAGVLFYQWAADVGGGFTWYAKQAGPK